MKIILYVVAVLDVVLLDVMKVLVLLMYPAEVAGRELLSESGQVITNNGGFGQNVGSSVGGTGSGQHAKGPGGNSGNAPQ